MSAKRYHLPNGTVLDGRYLIRDVIGEGGFGITYEGENKRMGMRVAVKEFFCKDYLDRDGASSCDVLLQEPEMEERFRKDKERFLKEARVLRDFSGESGVVHVNDYFEVNGTAYIVMPFLDGVTLREHVKRDGRMDPGELLRKLKPLLRVLGNVHETGLIHRDISPDNIMMLGDGSLCLIDFGAAYQYNKETRSYAVICKNGYAPPEQYRSDGRIGPAADLYSLAATVWFCLTGNDPEDSIQRVLFDELKTPGEMGIALPQKINQMLEKALNLSAEKRFQEAGEMLRILDEVYPEKKEESPKERRKRYLLTGIISAAAAAAVILGILYFRAHSVELRFRNIETETIWLTAEEDMTLEGYRRSADTVRERLEVFAGEKNYLWEESEGKIRLEFPQDVLCGRDPAYVCRAYLTRPLRPYLMVNTSRAEEEVAQNESEISKEDERRLLEFYRAYAEKEQDTVLEMPFTEEDLEEVTSETGEIPELDRAENNLPEEGDYRYLRLVLTEEAAARADEELGEILHVPDMRFTVGFDQEQNFDENYYGMAVTAGDGRTVLVTTTDQEGSYLDVLEYNFTHPSSDEAFYINEEWKVQWEDAGVSVIVGEWQRNFSELQDEALLLRYTGAEGEENKRAAWYHNVILMKERLDALEKPYAFGVLQYTGTAESSDIVIALRKDAIREIEALLLGSYCGVSLESPFSIENVYGESFYDGISFDGTTQELVITILSDYQKESLQKMLDLCDGAGKKMLKLTIGNYALAWISTDEIRSQLEKGELRVPGDSFAGIGTEGEDQEAFFTYLETFMNESPSEGMTLEDLRIVRENEEPERQLTSMLPNHIFSAQEQICEQWEEELGALGKASSVCRGTTECMVSLTCTGMDPEKMPQQAAAFAERICGDEAVENGQFSDISMVFESAAHEEDAITVRISRSYGRVGMELFAKVEHSMVDGAPDDASYAYKICSAFNEAVGNSSVLNPIKQEGLEEIRVYHYDSYSDLKEITDAEGNQVKKNS